MMNKEKWVSVGMPKELHDKLVALKVHPRQSLNEVIANLL